MRQFRLFIWAAFIAALLFASFPASADCPVGDPACLPAPPGSVQVNPHPATADGDLTSVEAVGELVPLEAVISMPAPRADVVPLGDVSAPSFSSLSVPVRYQDPSDVSCGVQALGMALDGLGAGAPASSALLGFLQGNGMMYDFGTGVEELAYAAQSFGYRGSYAFHNASLADLAGELASGSPVVVSLGSNGADSPGHFVTVTGISPDGQWVTYNDPTLGKVVVSAEEFLRLWGLQGNSGVSVATAPPPSAPDPMPWVALMAGIMALVSTTPFGRQRMGVGGRITSGGGAAPRPAPRPAPAPARPAPRPAPAPYRAAPAPARPAPAPAPAPVRVSPAPRPPTPPAPSLFSQISNAVSSAVSTVSTAVRNTVSTVSDTVNRAVSSASTAVRNTVSSVATTVRNTATTVSTAVSHAVSTTVSRAAAFVDDVADEARQFGRSVATTVGQAAATAGSAVRTTAQSVGNTVRAAATAAVSTVRTAAERVSNTARNVTAGALTAVHDAVAAATPIAQRIVAAPFIAAHDIVEGATSWARDTLVSVLAPAADSLRSIADHERNPQIASWREGALSGIQNSVDGWEQAFEGVGALGTYTLDAVADQRWEDAARAADGWRTASEEVRGATLVSTLQALGIVAWGAVTTPFRLVTQSVPNFARAVSERLEGEDRAWDVLFSGAMLEADIAGTYGLAKAATALLDRSGPVLSRPGAQTSASTDAIPGQVLIDDIAREELRSVRLSQYPEYDPNMPVTQYGEAARGSYTRIGPLAVEEGRSETLVTIVHEEMHHRLWARGWPQSEDYVEAVALRFAEAIGGR